MNINETIRSLGRPKTVSGAMGIFNKAMQSLLNVRDDQKALSEELQAKQEELAKQQKAIQSLLNVRDDQKALSEELQAEQEELAKQQAAADSEVDQATIILGNMESMFTTKPE